MVLTSVDMLVFFCLIWARCCEATIMFFCSSIDQRRLLSVSKLLLTYIAVSFSSNVDISNIFVLAWFVTCVKKESVDCWRALVCSSLIRTKLMLLVCV